MRRTEGRSGSWETAGADGVAKTYFGGWRDAALGVRSRPPCLAKTTTRVLKQITGRSAAASSSAVLCPQAQEPASRNSRLYPAVAILGDALDGGRWMMDDGYHPPASRLPCDLSPALSETARRHIPCQQHGSAIDATPRAADVDGQSSS